MKLTPLFPVCLAVLALSPASAEEPARENLSFRKQIKPVFREKCVHCHNRKTLPNEVSFESAAGAFVQTEAGQSIIVPGKPEESLLIIALESDRMHEKAMPMVGPRPTKEEIELLRQWIREGATWPKGLTGRIIPPFYATE